MSRPAPARWIAALLLAVSAFAVAACGSDDKKSSSTSSAGSSLSLTISEQGKTAKYTAPKSVKGGLVTLSLKNSGKRPHAAQLARITGGHTAQQALKVIASGSNKTPAWIRAEGGLGGVRPGQTASASVNLTAGKYVVADAGGPGGGGPPAYSEFTVTSGTPGSLPQKPTTVTAASAGKDKFEWKVSGSLKAGENDVTFASKGKDALHFIGAFRLKKKVSKAEIVKALKKQGKPAPFIDTSTFYNTAVLDGGKSQTTPLQLAKPGTYVLFCPLSDRDGGKPHFEEGLVTTVDVK